MPVTLNAGLVPQNVAFSLDRAFLMTIFLIQQAPQGPPPPCPFFLYRRLSHFLASSSSPNSLTRNPLLSATAIMNIKS